MNNCLVQYSLKKILSTDGLNPDGVKSMKKAGFEVTEKKLSREEMLSGGLKEFDVVVVRSATQLDAEVIRSNEGGQLKVLGRAGTGVDNIDMDAATQAGFLVMNTPAANSISAAELACGLICSLARHIPAADASVKAGKWERKRFMGSELYGKVLVVIGLGRIGREVAHRMKAFGMQVMGFDPLVSAAEAAQFDVQWGSLDVLWSQADYITVHVPLNKHTENLINRDTLVLCKPSVKIVNCSRGGIVNEQDLLTFLDAGSECGCGLDVYSEEPPLCTALLQHPRSICTPHIGASTTEAQHRVALEIATNLEALHTGTGIQGAVNGPLMAAAVHPDASDWLAILDVIAGFISPHSNMKFHLSYNDISTFTKHRFFETLLHQYLLIKLTLSFDRNSSTNLINSEILLKSSPFIITISRNCHHNLLVRNPKILIKFDSNELELSNVDNSICLTRLNGQELSQTVVLHPQKQYILMTESRKLAASSILTFMDSGVLQFYSYDVKNSFYVMTIDRSFNNTDTLKSFKLCL